MDLPSYVSVAEHFIDKYGFPIAVLIWMFWRDYQVMSRVERRLQSIADALNPITRRMEQRKREN